MIDACNAWWGESTTDGVPPSWINNFLPTDNKENDEKFEAVGHWTQMAWAKTYQIGCALKVCHKPDCNGNLIDCRYYPGLVYLINYLSFLYTILKFFFGKYR